MFILCSGFLLRRPSKSEVRPDWLWRDGRGREGFLESVTREALVSGRDARNSALLDAVSKEAVKYDPNEVVLATNDPNLWRR